MTESLILDERAVEEMQSRLDSCAQTGQAYRVKWSDVKAIIATIRSLRAQSDQVVEREAAVCPEDIAFDDYIRSLQSQLEQLRAENDHLSRVISQNRHAHQMRSRVVQLCKDLSEHVTQELVEQSDNPQRDICNYDDYRKGQIQGVQEVMFRLEKL